MRITEAIARIQKMRDDRSSAITREQDNRVREQLHDDVAALDLAEVALKDVARLARP